jgi:hypothetical protein
VKSGMVLMAAVAALMISAPVYAQAAPGMDSVTGSGAAGTGTFSISAQSLPTGASASGSVVFNLAIGNITGQVQALCVQGKQAVIAGTVTQGDFAGDGFVLQVQDGTPDLMQLQLTGYPVTFCSYSFGIVSPAVVTAGDLVVHDVAPVLIPPLQ